MKKLKDILKIFTTESKKEISFRTSLDLCNLPVIVFHQGKEKLNFILDTGSTTSIINKKELKRIKSYPVQEESSLVSDCSGHVQECFPYRIPMEIEGIQSDYTFVAKDLTKAFDYMKKSTGVTAHGLLGSDFFSDYQYVLDFKKLIAYSTKQYKK